MTGMSLSEVRVECTGEVFKMPVSEDMIGGFFDGLDLASFFIVAMHNLILALLQ